MVNELRANSVTLKATEQPIDTSTAAGKAFLDMLGVFAEFETNLRKERQFEGIAKAKEDGVYTGRKPSIDAKAVRALAAEGVGATEIAERLGISRASVYRITGALTFQPVVATVTRPVYDDPNGVTHQAEKVVIPA